MAKKKVVIEEPAVNEAANGLKELNIETAAPVAVPPVVQVAAVEELNVHNIGHATRAFRGR